MQTAQAANPLSSLHPEDLTDMFAFLDDLRESGVTNMFGARPYLIEEFPEHRRVAASVLSAWMNTFDRSTEPEDRARSAQAA
jgi:hypothetical protein